MTHGLPAIVLLCFAGAVMAQRPADDPRTAAAVQANAGSEKVRHAEDLLEHGDYKAAEADLTQLAAAMPADARIQYDLGFTQEHNGEAEAAAKSYLAAIAADPKLADAQVALGLLYARAGDATKAHAQLESAANITSAPPALKARALRALARLDEATDRAKSRDELLQAIQLTGEQPGDAEMSAGLAARSGDQASAEKTYRQVLAQNPDDVASMVGLAALLQRQSKLAEADALLAPALAGHPNDPQLAAQAASLYAAEGKAEDAISMLDKLRAADPNAAAQPAMQRLLAHLELVAGKLPQAEGLYRELAAADPNDPRLLDDLGSTLVREQKYPEAQAVLGKAVAMREAFHDDSAWGEAAGHLAFAASKNNQPQVTLQALRARATVLPNSAASLFLEATAHDTLHQRKEAERTYRAFLALAGGKLPDEEFQARHRLIALDHEH